MLCTLYILLYDSVCNVHLVEFTVHPFSSCSTRSQIDDAAAVIALRETKGLWTAMANSFIIKIEKFYFEADTLFYVWCTQTSSMFFPYSQLDTVYEKKTLKQFFF